jgi:DNA recombination-dependent growth factor C
MNTYTIRDVEGDTTTMQAASIDDAVEQLSAIACLSDEYLSWGWSPPLKRTPIAVIDTPDNGRAYVCRNAI